MRRLLKAHEREISIAIAIALLMLVVFGFSHGYFSRENLADLFLASAPVMIIALGMTLVILTGQIDISVGSIFAICSVVAGLCARGGLPVAACLLVACGVGASFGAINGGLVAFLRVPSIVVTLATMVALRDALRWETQGSWVGNLPANFQWFGLSQTAYTTATFVIVVGLVAVSILGLRFLRVGRMVFATGSNEAAAQLAGIATQWVVFTVFAVTGALTGLAATFNAVRFNQIPSNSGLGLELRVIAAVAVGGAAITGGTGTIFGTVLGVALLGSISTALTFLGVSAYWDKAIQGGIILGAISLNVLSTRKERHVNAINLAKGQAGA
jgi:rhamnose transport system permease protein